MARIFVNALSATHLSGRHVLYGHLSQLAKWSRSEHEYLVLAHPASIAPRPELPLNVSFIDAPKVACYSALRASWEALSLPRMMHRLAADIYFTPAGTILPRAPVPQVSLAQNPWCLTTAVPKSTFGCLKAAFQRRAYSRAQHQAELMVYNSNFMQRLYDSITGKRSQASLVVYQGIDESTHIAAQQLDSHVERSKHTILAVSAMAPWKGADILVKAVEQLRGDGIPALLRLVGPWPDRAYEAKVRQVIAAAKLENYVTITGKVDEEELHREFASARVFALPSRCESFGIPAVQAQAFGTPVVGSETTAMAEVCGAGGTFVPPDDVRQLAAHLKALIADDDKWTALSQAARANASRFRWEVCSRPLTQIFQLAS